jgi:hypothetical protein
VLNTSAVVVFWLGFESGSRRDQADTLVIGSFAEGRCGFGAALAGDSIKLFLDRFYFQAAGIDFCEPKALYIDE